MTSQTETATGEMRTFEWDYLNRLVAVIDTNSLGTELQRAEYTYDVMGRRIAKSVDADGAGSGIAQTLHFVYDRDQILLEFEADSRDPSQRYLYGPQIDQVLAQEDATGATLWLLGDQLGTIKDVVDESGVLKNHRAFDSYGNLVSETDSTFGSRYGFTGRELDDETGLYYYRARYYDGQIGRFISEDPIGFRGGSVNLHQYVRNNPINRVDPSGTKDTRWPGNGVATNNSSNPVFVLISNNVADHVEVLYPGASTPNRRGRSKDVDGVWICKNDKWVFYGNFVAGLEEEFVTYGFPSPPTPVFSKPTSGHNVITDSRVYDNRTKVTPRQVRPSDRGRSSSNNLFVGSCDCLDLDKLAKLYPDASIWQPVKPEDEWRGNLLEQRRLGPEEEVLRQTNNNPPFNPFNPPHIDDIF